MELKVIGSVILLSLVIFVIALVIPDPVSDNVKQNAQGLPWQIEQHQGSIRVFNLTLGKSTLIEAEKLLLGDAEISLFRSPTDSHAIEAYFDKVMLGGLSAKMILVMDIPESELSEMFQRGLRISKLGSGSNKVSLTTKDLHYTRNSAIASITYLPAINLNSEQLIARFGSPLERIGEPGGTIEHWLYPKLGLDVMLDDSGKEVLQYIEPSRFTQISTPLKQVR